MSGANSLDRGGGRVVESVLIMNEFVFEQFSISTAEDEQNYFTGQMEVTVQSNPNAILPPGMYRVIDGSLYRVLGGAPR